MGLHEDMKDFFEKQNIECVFSDEIEFKRKLNLSDKAMSDLLMAKDLDKYGSTLAAAMATGAVAYIAWLSSLGFIGQAAILVGLGSNPIGWIALAAGAGGLLMYGSKTAINKLDENAYERIPKYLNTPLDVLGTTLIAVILPIYLKLAINDKNIIKNSLDNIMEEFSNWGYDRNYLEQTINTFMKGLGELKIEDTKEKLQVIVKATDGLEYCTISDLITKSLENVFEKQDDKFNFRELSSISLELACVKK